MKLIPAGAAGWGISTGALEGGDDVVIMISGALDKPAKPVGVVVVGVVNKVIEAAELGWAEGEVLVVVDGLDVDGALGVDGPGWSCSKKNNWKFLLPNQSGLVMI